MEARLGLQLPAASADQLLEGAVKAALQVGVGHHQDALLVPRHQADLLRDTGI